MFDPNDWEMNFLFAAVASAAMLWHVEPDDPAKIALLHEACNLLNEELRRRETKAEGFGER